MCQPLSGGVDINQISMAKTADNSRIRVGKVTETMFRKNYWIG